MFSLSPDPGNQPANDARDTSHQRCNAKCHCHSATTVAVNNIEDLPDAKGAKEDDEVRRQCAPEEGHESFQKHSEHLLVGCEAEDAER